MDSGERLDENEFKSMMSLADITSDGKVNYSSKLEFLVIRLPEYLGFKVKFLINSLKSSGRMIDFDTEILSSSSHGAVKSKVQ